MGKYARSICCMAAVGTALMAAAPAFAEKFVVTTNLPPSHWGSSEGGVPFMECVTERSNGEIEFDYFDSSKIANFFESLNAVNDGLAQISYIVVSAQSDKLPLSGITLLPGLGDSTVDSTVATREVLDAGGPIAQEFANNRIVPLMINMFPAYQMLSRDKPLDSLNSLQGARVSSGGGTLLVTLAATGATAVESAAADLYLALQQGTVDGTMLSIASIKPYSLQEVIKSVSSNGNFGAANGIWSIDSGVWEGLSEEHKAAFDTCGREVELELAEWADNFVLELEEELEAQGVDVFEYSDEELEKIGTKLEEARLSYVKRLEDRGLPAQEAYDNYIKAIEK